MRNGIALLFVLALIVFGLLWVSGGFVDDAAGATSEDHWEGGNPCWADGCLDIRAALGMAPASLVARKPRCAIKDVSPPHVVTGDGKVGFTNQRYMVGEFINTCRDAVLEMGSQACLLEYDLPVSDDSTPVIVECAANRERAPFTLITPVFEDLYLLAKCDYTTIPRMYAISGYGWAQSLPTDGAVKYVSQPKRSGIVMADAKKSHALVHYCHVTAAGTTWRSFKYDLG